MKIAVTGPRGRLGRELVKRGCIPIEADVTVTHALNQELTELKPDCVIHCAAKTNVDMAETSPVFYTYVNACGTMSLAQCYQGKIVYISTDYIFDGANGPYHEKDKPDPLSIYGWSKLGGELAIRNHRHDNDLIVRTTILFDDQPGNFVTTVIKQLLDGETVSLPDDLYGSPTYIPHLADALIMAVQEDVRGIVNISGERVLSRFEFGQLIAEALNVNKDRIQPGPVTGIAPRPLRAGLFTGLAYKLGLPIGNPLEGVEEIINALEPMATR